MTNPEASPISVVGDLDQPRGVCFDPTLLSNETALKEIVRHQVFSWGSEIRIVRNEETITYHAFDLVWIE